MAVQYDARLDTSAASKKIGMEERGEKKRKGTFLPRKKFRKAIRVLSGLAKIFPNVEKKIGPVWRRPSSRGTGF